MNQPYTPLPPATRTSTMAIVSLISGIASWFLLPIIAAIVAVITGHMAKKEIKNSAGMVTCNGMATAGMVLGYIQLGLGLCVCIVVTILLVAGVISIPFFSNATQ
jgi:hypothetical protein